MPPRRYRRESALERRAVRWALRQGIIVSKLTDPTGAPDRVFWLPGGRPLLVEFKAVGELPTKLQQYYLDKLAAQGYRTAWVDSKEGFLAAVKEV